MSAKACCKVVPVLLFASLSFVFPERALAGAGMGTLVKAAATEDADPPQDDSWGKSGFGTDSAPEAPPVKAAPVKADPVEDAPAPETNTPSDTSGGAKIQVSFTKSKDKDVRDVAELLKKSDVFQTLAKGVMDTIRLKHKISVVFEDCDEINAYYDPDQYKISMCYELVKRYLEIFGAQNDLTEEQIGLHVINASIFTFFHELGHALIHNLDIPVTGKEEDAADDLATIILIDAGDDGVAAVFSAIVEFAESAGEDESKLDDLAFWDEHSLDSQRVYSAACMIYGSDPKKHSDLVGDDGIPPDRAEKCPAEYQQKYKSWERLLEPYIKS